MHEIRTLLLSANNNGSDTQLILRGRSFIYTINNKDPRIDHWEGPGINTPQP
jgi:hypothetical protein